MNYMPAPEPEQPRHWSIIIELFGEYTRPDTALVTLIPTKLTTQQVAGIAEMISDSECDGVILVPPIFGTENEIMSQVMAMFPHYRMNFRTVEIER